MRALLIASGHQTLFSVHLLAYAHSYPDTEYSLLIDQTDDPGIGIITKIARSMDIAVVTLEEASEDLFDLAIVHSYAHGDSLRPMLSRLRCDEVWYYADMQGGRFIFDEQTDLSRSELIYFSWEIRDEDMLARLAAPPRATRIVGNGAIAEIWRHVNAIVDLGERTVQPIGRHDLLVALRYWGLGPQYLTRHPASVVDAIVDLGIPAEVDRVVIKWDHRSPLAPDAFLEALVSRWGADARIEWWEEHPDFSARLGSLNVLDFHLFRSMWITGHMMGFDGTPTLLAAITQPGVTLHWPDPQKLGTYFFRESTVAAVAQTIRTQQAIVRELRAGKDAPILAANDGAALRVLLTEAFTPDTATITELRATIARLAAAVGLEPAPDLGALVQEIDNLLVAIRGRGELIARQEDLIRSQEQLAMGLSESNAKALRDVQRLEEERDSLASEVTLLSRETHRLDEVENAMVESIQREKDLAAQIADIRASRSWKMTGPVRSISARVRSIRQR